MYNNLCNVPPISLYRRQRQGKLVYAGYGRVEDYEWLQASNINVSGRLVIVKYGLIFRGDKVSSRLNTVSMRREELTCPSQCLQKESKLHLSLSSYLPHFSDFVHVCFFLYLTYEVFLFLTHLYALFRIIYTGILLQLLNTSIMLKKCILKYLCMYCRYFKYFIYFIIVISVN